MLTIRLADPKGVPKVLAIPVDEAGDMVPLAIPASTVRGGATRDAELSDEAPFAEELTAFARQAGHRGAPGEIADLPRPGRRPYRVLLVGVGSADEAGWRAAGAALARAAREETSLSVALPQPVIALPQGELAAHAVRGLAEGLLLATYRFQAGKTGPAARLRQVTLLAPAHPEYAAALTIAQVVASATGLARDLTNTPSQEKSPAWFAGRVVRETASRTGLRVRVREPADLAAEGFGGILAVGNGSTRGPRLVELAWRPRGAQTHVVLVGKGITFDTGGICVKPRDGMKLMRKDMGGAAAVIAATLAAADLKLPVRITTLAPLAENMASGSAYRPGDVVRHYGGRTSEILNTDAEGRIVLGDALAYAVRRLKPDVIVDLATLTGANAVALGKRTAALYSDNDLLAEQLGQAASAAGEQVWRLPMPDDYLEQIASHLADMANADAHGGGAGSVTAALFLREFTGAARDRWAHLDMSAPAWADAASGELAKGATGWGVRTLVRWLTTVAAQHEPMAGEDNRSLSV